MKRVSINRGR